MFYILYNYIYILYCICFSRSLLRPTCACPFMSWAATATVKLWGAVTGETIEWMPLTFPQKGLVMLRLGPGCMQEFPLLHKQGLWGRYLDHLFCPSSFRSFPHGLVYPKIWRNIWRHNFETRSDSELLQWTRSCPSNPLEGSSLRKFPLKFPLLAWDWSTTRPRPPAKVSNQSGH